MRLTTIILLQFFFVLHLFAQRGLVFYSNDLTPMDINNLVDDRDKWKVMSQEMESRLEKLKAEREKGIVGNHNLERANRQLFVDKSRLEGLVRLFELEKIKFKNELEFLRKDKERNKKKILELESKILSLEKIIQEQHSLIAILGAEIRHYKSVVSDQAKEIQKRTSELVKSRLQITKLGTDILIQTNRRKKIKSGLRENGNAFYARCVKRSKGLYIKTTYYLLSDEALKQKNYPKGQFYLYGEFDYKPILSKRFLLEHMEVPKKAFRKKTSDFVELSSQGIVFWGIQYLKLRRKLPKGNYYYILIIDDKITVMDYMALR